MGHSQVYLNSTRQVHNNFFGYRVPSKGKLLGYTLDFCQKPNDGIFHVFYWKPNTNVRDDNIPNGNLNYKATFHQGGPIISRLHGSQAVTDIAWASGSSLMDETRYAIDVEPDGYIFAVSDLSYKKQIFNGHGNPSGVGINEQIWSQDGWTGNTFQPPGGECHITVIIRFD